MPRSPHRAAARRFASALLAALALACAAPPTAPPAPPSEPPEEPEILLETEDLDRRAGERDAERVAAEMGIVDDPELTAYLERLGRRLVQHTTRRRFDYRFQIVDQEAPNAFALPGGFVYVSRGLLALANSEAEVANVLAHEIVHVSARHASARQQTEATALNPLMLPGVLMGAVLGERVGEALTAPFQGLNVAYVARYSRDQEREADHQGQELAARAGFDPAGMAHFLRSLENAERLRWGASRLPGFLDTHPATPERTAAAAGRAQQLVRATDVVAEGGSGDFLERLDGLMVGANPREGVFEGDRFLHPDLGFTLRFPEGWKLVNTPSAVGAVAPQRDAQVFLEFQAGAEDPEAAAEAFLADLPPGLSLRISRREPVRIGGLPAYRVIGRAAAADGQRAISLHWIAHGGAIYRLTASAPSGPSRRYQGTLQKVAHSFRPLTASERAQVQAMRLRIVRAGEDDTLEELGGRHGNAWDVQRTAVMNDLFAGTRLAPGRRVKIAVSEPYVAPAGADAPR